MRYHIAEVGDDGWTEWFGPRLEWNMRCCDCALVHNFQFRVENGKISLRVRRDERKTAASRRYKNDSTARSSTTVS